MKKILFISAVLCLSGCNYVNDNYLTDREMYKHRKDDAYMSNNIITAKVKAALINDPDFSNNRISVNVHQGTVQLSGFVDTKYEVKKAQRIAASVPGVMKVKNHLIVKK